MAIKQLFKSQDYAYINSQSTTGLLRAALLKVDSKGFVSDDEGYSDFFINPTTFDESKPANWRINEIPGLSDPILQWTSSGARTISFEALVTNDTPDIYKPSNSNSNTTSAGSTFIGKIASGLFNVASNTLNSVAPIIKKTPTSSSDVTLNELDIAEQLNFYRSLVYPIYNSTHTKLEQAPPLVVLVIGNTAVTDKEISSNARPIPGQVISPNTTIWAVTNIRIRITKQLSNLNPMEAMVEFNLTQYASGVFSGDDVFNS